MKSRVCCLAVTALILCSLLAVAHAGTVGSYGVDIANGWSYDYRHNPYSYPQCTWYAWGRTEEKLGISLPRWGNAKTWADSAAAAGYTVDDIPMENSIFVENWYATDEYGNLVEDAHGHVLFVEKIENGFAYYSDSNHAGSEEYSEGYFRLSDYMNFRDGRQTTYLGFYRKWIHFTPSIRGSELSAGFPRVLPDGDYVIAAAGSTDKTTFYYLDIDGGAYPAANDTNVDLYGPLTGEAADFDVWTITYNSSDQFYTIRQKGTNMCLDVYCGDTLRGTNVQVFQSNGASPQKWAIEHTGGNGYRLRPQCSGGGEHPMCLDIYNGDIAAGTQVQTWEINNSNAQSWLFIPYKPTQTLEDGRYVLLSGRSDAWELDVPGDTGDVADRTAVQLWADTASSQYNSFDITRLSNGYYSIIHAASGKALGVYGGDSDTSTGVSLYTANGSNAQQWAITRDGYDSGYCLRVKSSGYALDLVDGTLANGAAIRQYPWNGAGAETWKFVRAEYTVTYDCSGGSGGPEDQIKYYRTPLTASEIIPVKQGYRFLRWEYYTPDGTWYVEPGESLVYDDDYELVAAWQPLEYTISYDANGGTDAPNAVTVSGAAAVLSDVIPVRLHYRFLGWAADCAATAAEYAPGAVYDAGESITLYAVWERKTDSVLVLPRALTAIEEEAFSGAGADAVVIPASVTEIGPNAFDDVMIYGYEGSRAQSYAQQEGFAFRPITDAWVLADQVPTGAHITDEKWTYTMTATETVTSTSPTMDGWTLAGTDWRQTKTATRQYATFPAGFDTNSSLYAAYEKNALPAEETASFKRTVASDSVLTYIYWHWTWYWGSTENKLINDHYCWEDGLEYSNFKAYESGYIEYVSGTSYVDWPRGGSEDGSRWWFRFEVRQQTYTEYEKLYTYIRSSEEIQESAMEVTPGGSITNVQHWVKYSF